jgi:F-type H+-transporting ATPase subunit b
MTFSWTVFFIQIINFLILMAILYKFLFKKIGAIMEKRRLKIKDELTEAERQSREAGEERRQLEMRRTELERQSEAILARAKEEASEKGKQIVGEAQARARAKREKAFQALEKERETFFQEFREDLSGTVLDLCTNLLKDLAEPTWQERSVAKLLEELRSDEGERKEALLTEIDAAEGEIRVTSAFEIGKKERDAILGFFRKDLGREVTLRAETSSDLVSGVALEVHSMILRSDLRKQLEEALVAIPAAGNGPTPGDEEAP